MISLIRRYYLSLRADWLILPVVLAAGILRIYRISAQPLWLDEIYSVQLSRQGLAAILQTSLHDPHPPLYYILQMLTSGLWNVQSEWGWRWLSALCGILTISAFYLLCRRFSSRLASLLATLAFTASPFHIFFSQEARPYIFITLLAVYSTILVADLLADPYSRWRWIVLSVLSLLGLFSNYFYAIIVGVQALILLLRTHDRKWWIFSLLMVVGIALDGLLITRGISTFINQYSNSESLTVIGFLQSFAGEPARFGIHWQNWLIACLIGISISIGSIIVLLRSKKRLIGVYFFLQLFLALALFIILRVFLNIGFPRHEARQLLIMAPAVFSLLAIAFDFLGKYSKQAIPITLSICILIASGAGLQSYWNMIKGPESHLVLRIRPEIQSTDMVVSLDYSTAAASYFYLPGSRVANYLRENNNQFEFTDSLLLYPISLTHPGTVTETAASIRSSPRFWVLNRNTVNPDLYTALTERCTQVETTSISPFTATLLKNCQP